MQSLLVYDHNPSQGTVGVEGGKPCRKEGDRRIFGALRRWLQASSKKQSLGQSGQVSGREEEVWDTGQEREGRVEIEETLRSEYTGDVEKNK